jgi:hypothetical protein
MKIRIWHFLKLVLAENVQENGISLFYIFITYKSNLWDSAMTILKSEEIAGKFIFTQNFINKQWIILVTYRS